MTDERNVDLRPVVTWPRQVQADRQYVVLVDLALSDPATWPYPREEMTVGCVLSGGPAFTVEAVGGTSLVLHRFGGTYGPVRFLVRVNRAPAVSESLHLTYLTEGGWPFRTVRLEMSTSSATGVAQHTTTVTVQRRTATTRRYVVPRPHATPKPARSPVTASDLLSELRLLYRAAGQPSSRRISSEIRARDMPDTVTHETVNALLSGDGTPRWSKLECVVRVLASMAAHRPDPQVEVQRFLTLWNGPRVTPDDDDPFIAPIPPSRHGFIGREDLLELMRRGPEPWQPLILHGPSGVGKTSLATEFVRREMARYDVIWWIDAEQADRTRSELATFAEQLPDPVEITRSGPAQTVIHVLGALERASYRWLLVYDNATVPEQLRDLLPTAGPGMVIVTTRHSEWNEYGHRIPVEVLPRHDSVALLQRAGRISSGDADRLAERLGDLPLALEQSVATRTATGISVSEYLGRLDRQATVVLSEGRPRHYPETVAGAFGLAFDGVRQESAGAAELLAMLSCMSADPVLLALLRPADLSAISSPLREVLAADSRLDQALQVLERYGLITMTGDGQRAQVHRVVQLVVRDSLADADRSSAYDNARRLLTAANPGNPDDAVTWELHDQIGRHLASTGLLSSRDPSARRLVIDQIRYLYLRGDFDGSLRLSAEARGEWAGPNDVWDDDETFACIDRYALALIGLGRYREADVLYSEAWERLNTHERFGPHHNRTARAANGLALVSRILGRYGIASNLERFRVEHYEQDPSSDGAELMRARASQAVCYRATGEFERALEIDEQLVRHWQQAQGENDYRTQFAVSNLARDLYGLGRYEEALRLQENILTAMRDRLGDRHPHVMLADRTTAILLRRLGRMDRALRGSQRHFRLCQGEWGPEHGHTLAAAMTYANAIRAAAGTRGAPPIAVAYSTSLRALTTYRIRFGETNPLSLAAAVNHAIIVRNRGDRLTARRISESAYQKLLEQVGYQHPFTRAAAIGLANDLAAHNEIPGAIRLLNSMLDKNRDRHPDTLIGAINLGLLLREQDPQGASTLLDSNLHLLREALGSEHPLVLGAGRGERGECDIEPPPF